MKKLFCKEAINTGRRIEADIAKAICLFGMVIVHCFEIYDLGESTVMTPTRFVFVSILNTIFGAATFMFCMGLGLAYTKKSSPRQIMKRGVIIFFLGYLLNFLCGLGHLVILHSVEYFLFALLAPDILQFAGVALLLFGFLKSIKLPEWGIGAVAVVMSVAGTFLRRLDFPDILADYFLGIFVGIYVPDVGGTPFPLLNWFIFVVAGYYFAKLLQRCRDVGRLYRWASGVSAVAVVAYLAVTIPTKTGMPGDMYLYNAVSVWDALICIAGALTVLGLYYALSRMMSEKVRNFITNVSRDITKIYFVQWILIVWIYGGLMAGGVTELSDGILVLAGVVLFLISLLIARLITKLFARKKQTKRLA